MSNEKLGLVEEAQQRAEKYGRFAYRAPFVYIDDYRKKILPPKKPLTPLEKAQKEINSLRGQLGKANAKLRGEEDSTLPRNIEDVQSLFCSEYKAAGVDYTVEDLKGPRRSRNMAWPRHVCVLLVRDLCRWASLPTIGKAFSHRDHTTVIGSLRRAPEVLASDPLLREVHAKVMLAFTVRA